ncbi:MAG: exodeoxyribonuclease V subunit beta [Rubrivivax sp.]
MSEPFDVFAAPLDGLTLIEASAGTGKTWTLCGLYLRLLLERRLTVQQILVVTFTKAATAELRERIRGRVADVLVGLRDGSADPFVQALLQAVRSRCIDDGDDRDDDHVLALHLQQTLQSFDEAAIFTIHGFCQRALADTPFGSGAPLLQELLADDGELRLQVAQDFWRRRVSGDSALPPGLAAALLKAGDTPERWAQALQRRVAKPMSRLLWPDFSALPSAADEQALQQAFDAARTAWTADRDGIVERVLDALPSLNKRSYKPETVANAAAQWDQCFAAGDAFALPADGKPLDLLAAERLRPNKGQPPPRAHAFFALAQALIDASGRLAAATQLQRLALLRDWLDQGPPALRALKRERRVVGFDDLLLDLQARLAGPAGARLAAALRQRYPAALIDEFQDTDPLQFDIIRSLWAPHDARSGTLFLVGDPKQAIYGFRNADLHTYLQARAQAGRVGTLTANQRSTPALLQGLNALFGANPRAFLLPGLDYHPVAAGAKPRPLLQDRSAPQAAALQVWQLPADADGRPLPKPQAAQAAVQACADEIARLLAAAQQGQVLLDGRPLDGGDIAVLARTHRQGAAMRQALAARGVGSVELSQASVHASIDAEELEQVLAAVLQPTRTGLLRAALATALMGWDAAALQALAADEGALADQAARFAGYRERWLQRGIGPMLRAWMEQEQLARRLLQGADGERRLTNVLHLAERLQEAAARHPAPEALWCWLQQQRRHPGGDDSAQLRLESDRSLVQIVTIHKSKGLEYPIVFCPWLWEGPASPRRAGGADGIEHHDEQGRALLDFAADPDDPALKAALARERLAEDLRLVYVALTRAVHRCVLVQGLYRSGPGGGSRECGRSPLHWLAAGAGTAVDDFIGQGLAPESIAPAWAALAAAAPQAIELSPLPAPGRATVLPPPAAPPELQALPPPTVPPAWWIGSYSSLVQGLPQEARAAPDHDQLLAPPLTDDIDGPLAADPDDILHFPRGPAAGECLHRAFELAEFDRPASWPAAIAAALREHPQPLAAGDDPARHARQLQRALTDVLQTPLPAGDDSNLSLAELPRARRLVELEFHLRVDRLTPAGLNAVLQSHGWAPQPLAFGMLHGYLRGFIDLVFEHRGRWFIVDWKSNHLGWRPADYAAPSLARALDGHAYGLQALLYALALHRYLGRQLRGYEPARHLGGVMMLFVRGLRPAWRQPDGSPCGLAHLQPSPALLDALSELIA